MTWLRRFWPYLMFAIIGLLVYFPTFQNGFVWDDEEQIVLNQSVHSLQNWPRLFQSSTFNAGGATRSGGLYYKPLMMLTYAVLYGLAIGEASWFHGFQLLFHIANAGLFFSLLVWIFQRTLPAHRLGRSQRMALWFLAAVFLVHPLNVEAVAYIASLQDVLAIFWGLLALNLLFRHSTRWWSYLIAAIFLLAALLSKETGALFVMMAILGAVLFSRQPNAIRGVGSIGIVVVALYAWLRFGVAQLSLQAHGLSPITRIELSQRLISLPKILWFYGRTFIWPDHLVIAQYWLVDHFSLADFWQPLLIILFSLAIFAGWLLRTRRYREPTLIFFLTWFLLGLGLHAQFFPLDMTVADRWFAFPMLGLLGLGGVIVWPAVDREKQPAIKWFWLTIGLIALLALGTRSWFRIQTWRDSLTLYSQDVQQNPDAFDLTNNYGVALYRAGRADEALGAFRRSTEIAPYWWTNWNNLGAIQEQQGKIDLARQSYQKAIDNGQYYLAYENQASLLVNHYPEEAISFIETALPILPYNLKLWHLYILALEKQGRIQDALPVAQELAERTGQAPFTELYQKLKTL